jgi:hypothetical protein
MTRRGKIARLPQPIREQGNTRFEGERTRDGHADRFGAACAAIEAAATATDPNRIFAQII